MSEPTDGIVRVLAPSGETAGTAFLASEDGLVVTCAHVVDAALATDGSVALAFLAAPGTGGSASVEQACTSPAASLDLAVLRLRDAPPAGATRFVLGNSADALGGVYRTFGFPAVKPVDGLAGKVEVTGFSIENGSRVLQLRSNEVSRGFSGAPVWNKLGAVIGIVVSIVPAGVDPSGKQSEVSFVRPVESLLELCPRLRPETACPYRGLQLFEEEHASWYFGRGAAAEELLAAVAKSDFVAVVGVSGSGKSSLARAGLARAAAANPTRHAARLRRRLITPGIDAVASLAETLRAEAGKTLLVVDQFERLFTEGDADSRAAFVDELVAVSHAGVKTVIVLRADFYDRVLNEPALGEAIKGGSQVTLLAMSKEELREAIVEPARLEHRSVEPRLVGALIDDVHGRAGDLPLLQFALTELWKADAYKGVVTLQSYDRLGGGEGGVGMRGALAGYAEDEWAQLTRDEQRMAKAVLLRLAGAGATMADAPGRVDTSRRARMAELDPAAQNVATKLADRRLLTTGTDADGAPTVEVVHEALIRAWPRLYGWIERDPNYVRWYDEDLRPFLRSWEEQGRSDDQLVLRGAPLAEASRWLRDHGDELAGPAAEFIEANLAAARSDEERRVQQVEDAKKLAAAERRRARTFRRATAGLVVLLGLFAVATVIAVDQRSAARDAQRKAESGELAQLSLLQLADDPNASLNLAIQALDKAATPQAETALRAALLDSRLVEILGGADAPRFRDIAFASSGNLVAAAGADGTVTVWRRAGWQQANVLGTKNGPEIISVAFNSKGNALAAGDQAGNLRVWSLPDGAEQPPRLLPGWATSVAFSADDSLLAGASTNGQVRIWNLETGGRPRSIDVTRSGSNAAVTRVAFGAGHRLLTAAEDGRLRIYDAETGAALSSLDSGAGRVAFTSASFGPGGLVLAGANDGVARLWKLPAWTPVEDFEAGSLLHDVTFARGGKLVAAAGADGKSRVWSRETHSLVTVLRGHRGAVFAIAASGSMLATASIDKSARIWRTPDEPIVLAHPKDVQVSATAFVPGQRSVVTAGTDGRVRLWTATGRLQHVLTGQAPLINAIDVTPDGRLLAAAGQDSRARVWALPEGTPRRVLSHPEGAGITSVAFSPDAELLATASDDGGVRVWSMADRDRRPRLLVTEKSRVLAVAFSRDGEWLAAAGEDSTVRLWRTEDWTALPQIRSRGSVEHVAFSPDGKLVAGGGENGVTVGRTTGEPLNDLDLGPVHSVTFAPRSDRLLVAADDGTASIWSADGGRRLAVLEGHSDPVERAVFDRDGTVVLTVSADGTGRLWDAFGGGSIGVVSRHQGGVLDGVFSPDAKLIATAGADGFARIVPCEVCAQLDTLVATARSRVAQ